MSEMLDAGRYDLLPSFGEQVRQAMAGPPPPRYPVNGTFWRQVLAAFAGASPAENDRQDRLAAAAHARQAQLADIERMKARVQASTRSSPKH